MVPAKVGPQPPRPRQSRRRPGSSALDFVIPAKARSSTFVFWFFFAPKWRERSSEATTTQHRHRQILWVRSYQSISQAIAMFVPCAHQPTSEPTMKRTDTHPQNTQLTTTAGNPIADNQNSLSAGPRGPLLLQDY